MQIVGNERKVLESKSIWKQMRQSLNFFSFLKKDKENRRKGSERFRNKET